MSITFEETIKENDGLLNKIAFKVHQRYLFNEPYEDIKSMIVYVAWQAFQARERQKSETGEYRFTFGAYLEGAMRNALRTDYKEFKYRNQSVQLEKIDCHDNNKLVEDIDLGDLFNSVLENLNENEAILIRENFFNGKNLNECAQILNMPVSTAFLLKKKTLAKLKDRLERHL